MTASEKREKEIIEKGRALGYEGTIIENGKLAEDFIDWVAENLPRSRSRMPAEWEQYLESIPAIDTSDLVYYKCQDCGKEFPVGQRSRARYCDVCVGRRQREGIAKRKHKKE